jgi:hypothetical protein
VSRKRKDDLFECEERSAGYVLISKWKRMKSGNRGMEKEGGRGGWRRRRERKR